MPLVYQETGGTLCAVMSVKNLPAGRQSQQQMAPFTLKSSGNPLIKVVPFGLKWVVYFAVK